MGDCARRRGHIMLVGGMSVIGVVQSPIVYVGIATVRGRPAPVYRTPDNRQQPLGYVVDGGYVPHFQATDDHAWLRVTLHNGDVGWMPNDPARVTIELPVPNRTRVCIDPGHGGTDAGARAFGLVEKELNFDVAFRGLGPLLQGDSRIDRVWLTRNGDYDVSLRYRWDLANAAFPALFVGVHFNANPDPQVRGTETYFKCGAEATPPIVAESRRAACLIHLRLREQIQGWADPACPWVDRGVICRLLSEDDPRSYYYVLANTNTPATLLEALYMTDPGSAECLRDVDFRGRLARAIYEGIADALFSELPGDACDFRTLYGL